MSVDRIKQSCKEVREWLHHSGKPFRVVSANPKWNADGTEKLELIDPRLGQYAEPTGIGNLLCYDSWGGRFFRCTEEHVRKCVQEFVEDYKLYCRALDEDPAHAFYETLNWNDLYAKYPIAPSPFGDKYGYTNAEDYRQDIKIMVTLYSAEDLKNTVFALYNEPILVIEPADQYSYPNDYYLEV